MVNERWKRIPLLWLWALAGAALVGMFVFVFVVAPSLLIPHPKKGLSAADELKARNDVRTTLVQALAGLAVAGGLVVTYNTYRQNREEQDRTYERELYAKGVEQLGHEKAPVRLGALYSLERLAHDKPERRQTIVNVICAYLRMPFLLREPASKPKPAATGEQKEPDTETRTGELGDTWRQERQVRLTAQHILAEHLRGDGAQDQHSADPLNSPFWPGMRLDLGGATLIDFNLENSIMADADFRGATFSGTARFGGATFSRPAMFGGATFSGPAMFGGATFSGTAAFDEARFNGPAMFGGARFNGGAGFDRARFNGGAGFDRATFSGTAAFDEATFSGGTRFDKATFSGTAGFRGAAFSGGAWFGKAVFNDIAGFDRATFSGAAMFGGAAFSDDAMFGRAAFNDVAGFGGALFSSRAGFDAVAFNGDAIFGKAVFGRTAGFSRALFSSTARFDEASFNSFARFGGVTFSGAAGFGRAVFSHAARFGGATFSGPAEFDEATFSDGADSFDFEQSRVRSSDTQHSWPSGWRLRPDGDGGYTVVRAHNDGMIDTGEDR